MSKRQICFATADHAHFASALEQTVLERGYGPKLGGRGLFAPIALISSLSFLTTRGILFQRLSTCDDGEVEAFYGHQRLEITFFITWIHAGIRGNRWKGKSDFLENETMPHHHFIWSCSPACGQHGGVGELFCKNCV